MKNIFFIVLFISSLSACKIKQQIPYFSLPTYDSSHMFVHESYEVPIQVGDQLQIVVSAFDPASAAIYNLPSGNKGLRVDNDGYIDFPQLGKVKVVGLTRPQLQSLFIARLKTYLTDPIVMVEFGNFKVTILGEVNSLGPIAVPDGKINILEAIAAAGDITPYGKKHMVQVIRESNGKREFGWINLYSPAMFTSPYFRLRQNDIVYVHSSDLKPLPKKESQFRENLTFVTSMIGIVTTIVLLFTRFN